jgi:uncharacterized membrane protein YuzA (DUF378 family)
MANSKAVVNVVGILAVVLVVVGAINWLLLGITGKHEKKGTRNVIRGANIVELISGKNETIMRIIYVLVLVGAVLLLAGGLLNRQTVQGIASKLPGKSKPLAAISLVLIVVGSLVWGIEGIAGINVVEEVLGGSKGGRLVADIIYYAVGISAILFVLGGAKIAHKAYVAKMSK